MPTTGGKIEPEAADAWRAANREPLLEAPATPEAAAPVAPITAGTVSGLTAARTEREEIKAKREAIKLGFEEGELAPVAETEQAWSEMVQTAKDRLMILPGKLAGRLAAVSDEGQVHSILEREITSALAELAA
jgi:hypothetical protein